MMMSRPSQGEFGYSSMRYLLSPLLSRLVSFAMTLLCELRGMVGFESLEHIVISGELIGFSDCCVSFSVCV